MAMLDVKPLTARSVLLGWEPASARVPHLEHARRGLSVTLAAMSCLVILAALSGCGGSTSESTATTTVPTVGGSAQTAGTTAGQALLGRLVVKPGDVSGGYTTRLNPKGDQVTGRVTLDLCQASFPSESLRKVRRQVAVYNGEGQAVMSIEAVQYGQPGDTAQAFRELQSAMANCPRTFVPPVVAGQPAVKTVFNPPPDTSWPSTPGVDRLAFDFTLSDQQGHSGHFVAVYLRRGRTLLALYFYQPDGKQAPVDGRTTIAGIVSLFAARLAHLSSSATG